MTDWEAVREGAFYELLADQVEEGYFDQEDDDE
jgi:hypothetical protein